MKLPRIAIVFIILAILLGIGLVGIQNYQDSKTLTISTTTSVENSGLLAQLLPVFEENYGLTVKVIPVGSGAAIDLGRKGEVDALLVHAPNLEQELVDDGLVVNHTTLWYNYFLIAGPASDPANISGASTAREAMTRIYETKSPFYSRGDNSGTHIKELSLWETVPDVETDTWYFETGSGMSNTLTTANEFKGYVLTDLGTFTQLKASGDIPNLVSLFSGDDALYNPYSYMVVSPDVYDNLNTENAMKFLEFLQSDKAIEIVANYRMNGTQLFTPIGWTEDGSA